MQPAVIDTMLWATAGDALAGVERQLVDAEIESPRLDSRLLVAHATGLSRAALLTEPGRSLSRAEAARIAEFAARRARREPVALILGRREFWSLDFAVSPATLVPRPDSECLVEAALESLRDPKGAHRVLDLGTGTGCLLLALLHEMPNAVGVGIDIDPAAVALAAGNARRLGLASRAAFAVADWGAALAGRFDVIVCNPPYVTDGDWRNLDDDVRLYEPRRALESGTDGLNAYRALAPDLARLLAPDGWFIGEIGAGQGRAAREVLMAAGLSVQGVRRDLADKDRCVLATPGKNEKPIQLNV